MTTDKTKPLAGKRILHVINSDGGGGVEHLSKTLQKHQFLEGGITKTLFLYSSSGSSKWEKIAGIFRAAKDISRFKPDILMTFQPSSSVIASLVARLAGCRACIIHQSNLPRLTHKLPRLLDRLAGSWGLYSVIIMNSATTRQAFKDYPAHYRRRLRDIPHGVDPQSGADILQRRLPEKRAKIRQDLGISPTTPVLFSCARLSPEKSLETIIEALPNMPKTLFLLAGDGAHKQVLQDLAQKLDVSKQVMFLGHVDQKRLPKLYLASDLFVFPSKTETFGMAAVEAAMAGMVIVASDIPTVREVLSVNGRSAAILVKGWQTKDWVDALSKTLKDDAVATQAQKLAPQIRALYSTEKMLQKYADLYREMF